MSGGPPAVTGSRIVYENRWMRLREDTLRYADGRDGLYAVVEKSPAALVVPVQDGRAWLIEQYRHPVGARFWEFPQGAWDERPDAPAHELAAGELREETGLRAESMELLSTLYFAYGISSQPVAVWLATGLVEGEQELEETEAGLRAASFAVDEVDAMVRAGTIQDAASVAAWGLARSRL